MGKLGMFRKWGVWVVLAIVFATATVLGTAGRPAIAQEKPPVGIGISPAIERIELKPGDVYEGSFTIKNIGSKRFDFNVYVKPYAVTDKCVDDYDNDNSFTQLSRWITLYKDKFFDLQPDGEQTVRYKVKVPKDAPSGGQYAVIFAETMGDDSGQDGMIKTENRIGIKLFADMGGESRQSGEVVSVEQGGLYWTPPIHSTSTIRNTGNTDFSAEHVYRITGLGGKEVYKNSQKLGVLPDTCIEIKQQWDRTPSFGIFWVENKIDFLGHEQYSQKKLVLVLPIYIVVIFGLMIALLIWALVLRIKGNRTKSRVKVHGKKL